MAVFTNLTRRRINRLAPVQIPSTTNSYLLVATGYYLDIGGYKLIIQPGQGQEWTTLNKT